MDDLFLTMPLSIADILGAYASGVGEATGGEDTGLDACSTFA